MYLQNVGENNYLTLEGCRKHIWRIENGFAERRRIGRMIIHLYTTLSKVHLMDWKWFRRASAMRTNDYSPLHHIVEGTSDRLEMVPTTDDWCFVALDLSSTSGDSHRGFHHNIYNIMYARARTNISWKIKSWIYWGRNKKTAKLHAWPFLH